MNEKRVSEMIIWRLASVRLNPDSEKPELYCLILEGKTDKPLSHEGRIIFFSDPALAETMIKRYGKGTQYDDTDIESPFFRCDIAGTLYVLTSETYDKQRVVIDTVNVLLDLVKFTAISLPAGYRQILFKIADYFTFESDVANFYRQEGFQKDDVVNSLLWCIGAVTTMSVVL